MPRGSEPAVSQLPDKHQCALAAFLQRLQAGMAENLHCVALYGSAVRAFAVKFASIARAHRVLHGVDVLSALQVRPELTRFLLEQALLNARLRSVQAFLSSRGHSRYARYAAQLVPQLMTERS